MADGYENCPNAVPVQTRTIGFSTAVSYSDMVTTIKGLMTTPGLYIINGSYYGRTAGYTAICQCYYYSSGSDLTSSGTIYFTNGSDVITFTNNSVKKVTITNP